jgi:hypothetical protein
VDKTSKQKARLGYKAGYRLLPIDITLHIFDMFNASNIFYDFHAKKKLPIDV